MSPSLLDFLRKVDTPTVCNAIEIARGKRGFEGYTRGTLLSSAPSGTPAIVGYACTAKLAGLHPPVQSPEAVRKLRMDYYRAMAEAPKPSIAVTEDEDFPHCVGAFWGEINTAVHKSFGMSGVLTNGVMRDLDQIPDTFPVIAGSIGPSHAFVHITEVGSEVELFGLKIRPGALLHADRHGAVVIPDDVIPTLAKAINELIRIENIVISAAHREDFDFDIFTEAWAAFEDARV